jgi:DNA-binding NarL/FixJ family response regulator
MESGTNKSVFVVDDSDSIRQRLISMLATMGNVRIAGEAANVADAIEGIVTTRPEIVLLDLNLGTGSGMEVLHEVTRKLPSANVVVLTNHAEPQYRRACLKAGARHFLDKSTQFESVRSVIAECEPNATGRES